MVGYLDGTLKHEQWFKGGRRILYREMLFGFGGFPFLLYLLIHLNTKVSYDFENTFDSCFSLDFLYTNFKCFWSCFGYYILVINISCVQACPLHVL